jgi:hypothetical protein
MALSVVRQHFSPTMQLSLELYEDSPEGSLASVVSILILNTWDWDDSRDCVGKVSLSSVVQEQLLGCCWMNLRAVW